MKLDIKEEQHYYISGPTLLHTRLSFLLIKSTCKRNTFTLMRFLVFTHVTIIKANEHDQNKHLDNIRSSKLMLLSYALSPVNNKF